MFKKILLLVAIAVLGAWAAGYDFASFKRDVQSMSGSSAETLSGSSETGRDGWGS